MAGCLQREPWRSEPFPLRLVGIRSTPDQELGRVILPNHFEILEKRNRSTLRFGLCVF